MLVDIFYLILFNPIDLPLQHLYLLLMSMGLFFDHCFQSEHVQLVVGQFSGYLFFVLGELMVVGVEFLLYECEVFD